MGSINQHNIIQVSNSSTFTLFSLFVHPTKHVFMSILESACKSVDVCVCLSVGEQNAVVFVSQTPTVFLNFLETLWKLKDYLPINK